MTIQLAFLGTGTCNATPRNPASLALSNGDEVHLIDAGGGCFHQLSRLADNSFYYEKISTLYLTHFHMDHVSGLPDIFWGTMWDVKGPRRKPLRIIGPVGLNEFLEKRFLPFLGDYIIPFPIEIVELKDGDICNTSFGSVKSVKLSHSDPSTGYLFDFNAIRLGITGDTGYCGSLVDLLGMCDIAVMEWSYSEDRESPSHISNTDIIKFTKEDALPDKIYITHVYPIPGISYKKQVEVLKSILGENSGRFIFPEDLHVASLI